MKSIVLPTANALGERMKNRIERLFEKTGKMVQDAGITPQPVEDKLVVEIVRNAALEDNENLQTMWAALLANAASPDERGSVNPGFVSILTRMSPDEATLLNWIYKTVEATVNDKTTTIHEAYEEVSIGLERLSACFNALEAEWLIRDATAPSVRRQQGFGKAFSVTVGPPEYSLTDRGVLFVTACQPPKPRT